MGDPAEPCPKPDEEFETVFCASFFHKKLNRRVYAHEYGKKVFALRFRRKSKAA